MIEKLRLAHFSYEPLVLDRDRDYSLAAPRGYGKPAGLWLSDESDPEQGWAAWCLEHGYATDGLAHVTEFELVPDANVLHIGTPAELTAFHAEFSHFVPEMGMTYFKMINWADVRKRWGGILITPYQGWGLGPDLLWYMGWDCASGCFWDLSTIKANERQGE